MAISRKEILEELMPALNAVFGTEYKLRQEGDISRRELVDEDKYCNYVPRYVITRYEEGEWKVISEPMGDEESMAIVKAASRLNV